VTRSKYAVACMIMALILPSTARSGQWQEFSGVADISSLATLNHVFSGGTTLDGIPSLTNPEFVDPDEVDFIDDDAAIMGVYLNGIARA
jgi:hypothetical protein